MQKVEKVKLEREILESSLPLLNKIYGNFTIDEERKDSPDAAIILEQSKANIGIEITRIDCEDVFKYFNDEKNLLLLILKLYLKQALVNQNYYH